MMTKRGILMIYIVPGTGSTLFAVLLGLIGAGNKAFAKLNFLHAVVVLSTTPGLDVYQWKRSENVDYYIHIFHSAGEVTDTVCLASTIMMP